MNTFDKEYNKYKDIIDKELLQISLPEELEEYKDSLVYPLKGKGKRIRPVLVILSGTSLGAELEYVLPAAVAIEILHTFTLVHDDIMDGDEKRRGLPTVHKKWDINDIIIYFNLNMKFNFFNLIFYLRGVLNFNNSRNNCFFLKEKGKNVKNLGALTNTFIYNEWGALNGHFHPPKKKT